MSENGSGDNPRARMRGAIKRTLLRPATFINNDLLYMNRMSMACAKGALAASTRRVDPRHPPTWEFSAFSQNGEDGIVDQLLSMLVQPERYFVEVGTSDGVENNTAYLALVHRYSGVMVEADLWLSQRAARHLQAHMPGVQFVGLRVSATTAGEVAERCLTQTPDFLSVDVDGNDLHVLTALLEAGLRPKLICVEYNSAFGPDRAVTIPYDPGFDLHEAHPEHLYYGASIAALRASLGRAGYEFVTVDSTGVNAFFADPTALHAGALDEVEGLAFRENYAQQCRTGEGWEYQSTLIEHLPVVAVD